jgi:membrane protease subunit HflK
MKEKEKNETRGLAAAAVGGIVAVVAAAGLLTSVYHVTEQEQAVVTRFGKVLDVKSAGLYFRAPFFIDRIHKVKTTTSGLPIGYTVNEDTKQDGQNPDTASTDDSTMITSDFNLLDVDFYLEYRVSDPVKYIYSSSDPEGILTNLTKSAIRSVVSDYTVDAVMTTDKSKVQSDIKTALAKSLEKNDIGIQVVNLSMQDAEPPTAEIMTAFKNVENAKQDASTAVTNAKKYQSEQMPKAEAEADKIEQDAEAKKAERIADADAQVAIFNKTYEQYEKYPLITKKRMFYETMEEVMPDLKVVITDGNTQEILPLEALNSTVTIPVTASGSTDEGNSESNG